MAQFIFWNWEDDDSSANLNYRTLGISEPGLYRGFDPDLISGLSLKLIQTDSGVFITKTDKTITQRGVVLTKQGVLFQEDADVNLTIASNPSSYPRIDLIILTHEYVPIRGGSIGTYQVLEGTPAPIPLLPTIPAPIEMVTTVLGQLYVPSGTTSLTDVGVEYTKSAVPIHANDDTIMRTNLEQYSTKTKRFNHIIQDNQTCIYDNLDYSIDLQNKKSNNFWLDISATPTIYLPVIGIKNNSSVTGNRFTIACNQYLTLYSGAPGGNITFANDSINNELYVDVGEVIEVVDLNALFGIMPAVPNFYVYKKSNAEKNSINKFRRVVEENKSTMVASSNLDLNRKGNFYEITQSPTAPWQLNLISDHHTQDFALFTMPDVYGGTNITLYFNTDEVTIKNNFTPTSGFKKIITGTGADILVKGGGVVRFVEHEDFYLIVAINDSNIGPRALSDRIDVITTAITPTIWHVVGAVGEPAFTSSTTSVPSFQPLRFRKDSNGTVTIEGSIQNAIISTGTPIVGMFNLPVGSRPSTDHLFVVSAQQIASSTEGVNITIFIYTSGVILIGCPDPKMAIGGWSGLFAGFKIQFETT